MERGIKVTQEQTEVMEELALEIEHCSDPEEKAEFERTLKVCREMAYAVAEEMIYCTETDEGELTFSTEEPAVA